MKRLLLIFLIFYLIIFYINISIAQTNRNHINNKLLVKIVPVKKVFLENDSAFFKVTFTNNTDSVIHISKFPIVCYSDYFDMYPDNHDKDIYTFLLKQSKKQVYNPFLFSITDEIYGDLGEMIEKWTKDSILREEKIPINKGGSITLLIDLFPLKSSFPSGKYKARIAFFLNNERPFILIKSNWAKFVFEKNHEK